MATASYLAAKRTVDDRALSNRVLGRVGTTLKDQAGDQLSCLELGAGRGDMPIRLLEGGVLPEKGTVVYEAIERQPELVATLPDRVARWAADHPTARVLEEGADADVGTVTVEHADRRLVLTARRADAHEALDRAADVDLIVAKAFLDLVDPGTIVPAMLARLAPGGLAYCPGTFEADTTFLPRLGPIDAAVVSAYHATMDERAGGGASRAATETIEAVIEAGGSLEAVAGADWVVRPVDGAYPAREAAFLRTIVDGVRRAIEAHPTIDFDPPRAASMSLETWTERRQAQRRQGALVFLARHLDLLVSRS